VWRNLIHASLILVDLELNVLHVADRLSALAQLDSKETHMHSVSVVIVSMTMNALVV